MRPRVENEPPTEEMAPRQRLYGSDGRLTSDPGSAIRGEVVEFDRDGRVAHRSWLRVEWIELKWLPVSEPAFLLWVLAVFVAVWVAVAIWLEVL